MTTRRGLTLIETIAAMVIGGIVLSIAVAVLGMVTRADGVFARRSAEAADLSITQQAMRKSFMTLVLAELDQQPTGPVTNNATDNTQDANTDPNADPNSPQADATLDPNATTPEETLEDEEDALELLASGQIEPRDRCILEIDTATAVRLMWEAASADGLTLPDPSGGLGAPQRLEVVVSQPPVPAGMSRIRGWATRDPNLEQQLFSAQGIQPPAEGGIRGCFELRPDGARERVLAGVGVGPRAALTVEQQRILDRGREPVGWTLWWRRISDEEYLARQRGAPFDPDLQPEYLIDAVPLAKGLTLARWVFIAGQPLDIDEETGEPVDGTAYIKVRATSMSFGNFAEAPGFAEFEIESEAGSYGNWAFELGWSIEDEALLDADDAFGEEPTPDDADPTAPDGQQPLTNSEGAA